MTNLKEIDRAQALEIAFFIKEHSEEYFDILDKICLAGKALDKLNAKIVKPELEILKHLFFITNSKLKALCKEFSEPFMIVAKNEDK